MKNPRSDLGRVVKELRVPIALAFCHLQSHNSTRRHVSSVAKTAAYRPKPRICDKSASFGLYQHGAAKRPVDLPWLRSSPILATRRKSVIIGAGSCQNLTSPCFHHWKMHVRPVKQSLPSHDLSITYSEVQYASGISLVGPSHQ